MPKNKKLSRDCMCEIEQYCNGLANQYLVLVTIFSAIIAQEIDNDEDLGILGSFLIAMGEELSLASEMRIACKAKYGVGGEDEDSTIEDIFDRGSKHNSINKTKKIKKIKKVKK